MPENQTAFWTVTLDEGAKFLISQSEKCRLKIWIAHDILASLGKNGKRKDDLNASCSRDKKFTEVLNIFKTHLKLDSQLSSISLRLNQFKLQINEFKWLIGHSV